MNFWVMNPLPFRVNYMYMGAVHIKDEAFAKMIIEEALAETEMTMLLSSSGR